jgi:probable HAF family extracellular repeat protein
MFLLRTTHPFLWEKGRMTDLGTLGGTCALPLALNNRGQVVGVSDVPGDSTIHAFLWPGADGKMQDLGTLGGSFSEPWGINEAGEVVGDSDNGVSAVAFLWKKGVMSSLGFLSGDCASSARSVNSKGQIVGYSSTQCDFSTVRRAVLWEDGSMVDLNTLIRPGSGIQVALAETINDRGEIAADGAPSGCEIVENCGNAVLLIPCDENHPGMQGCDYSAVEGSEVAASHAITDAAPQRRLSPKEIKNRMRALLMNRQLGFGQKP